MQTNGGIGLEILSTPSKNSIGCLLVVTIPIPFAQSITLPPPRASSMLHLLLKYSSAPFITSESRGLGETDEKT